VNVRRLGLFAVLVAGSGLALAVGAGTPDQATPQFASLGEPTMPFVPTGRLTTATWFCPGMATAGDDSGSVTVENPTDAVVTGRLTLFSTSGSTIVQPLRNEPRRATTIELDPILEDAYVSAVVELDGGLGVVEQEARSSAGVAVSPCSNSASGSWYLADGTTVDGATYDLVITNPFPDIAVVDFTFFTDERPLSPVAFQGFVVAAQSVTVIDIREAGVRDEELVSIQAVARRGRFVMARSQRFAGGGRLGYDVSLGAPSLGDQWWFADGDLGDGINEDFVIFNPNEDEAEVTVVFFPMEAGEGLGPDPFTLVVDGLSTTTLRSSTIPDLPAGRHAAVVSTITQNRIVVERVLTRPAGDLVSTTVVLGSRFPSSRWHVPTPITTATEGALVVSNASLDDGTVSVLALGPGGEVPVPGLDALPIAANGVITIDAVAPELLGKPFVVTADVQIVVERSLRRGEDRVGRDGSLALPE
jgi:hypothetical protein